MPLSLTTTKLNTIKQFIYQQGRLLERKYFAYFFENGTQEDCLQALRAYQNSDGGFGNGLEPDLLCPESSPIGMETAFYYLDMLDCPDKRFLQPCLAWLDTRLKPDGTLPSPPETLHAYPHQPWWNNPDTARILSITAYLKKWNIDCQSLYDRVKKYADLTAVPHPLEFYDYPYYLYLKYFPRTEIKEILWKQVNVMLPELLSENEKHYPLIGRHWYLSMENFSKSEQQQQVQLWIEGLQEDGGLDIVYRDLPWWRPLWTLDGLMVMKKFGLLEIKN